MSFHQIGGICVELGDPVPFGEGNRRDVILTAALGAPFGTTDPVDLALLSAASHKEDLRHYEQLSFTPLEPATGYSVARVRKLATGEEEVIARGELESILTLCHPDEAVRYRAELQADLKMYQGYGVLGVARVTGGEDRSGWSLVGSLPVRATRDKGSRSDQPENFRYVQVWDWQLRTIHWFTVFLILVLSATGVLMGESRFIYDGHSSYFSYLRLIHFSAGWFLVATAILRVAGLFLASNRFQRWDALFPVKPLDLKNLYLVAQNYLFCRFDRGPNYIGHNPLQQLAYTAIYAVGIAAIVTGFSLFALYSPQNPFFQVLIWLDNLVGVQRIRLIHLLIMYIFLAFIPIHVYLSIRADTVEREGAISSIVSGGRWCRKGSKFEDDQQENRG